MYKNFLELCKSRRSIRKYLNKKVPRELIIKCIEAASYAPSAENKQPWRFIIIDEEPLLSEVKKNAFSGLYFSTKWANSAPVIIIVLSKIDFLVHKIVPFFKKIDYHFLDIGIATEHLILQATELGLGTCWIGWFNAKKLRKILKIPYNYKIAALLTLGFYDKKNYKLPDKKLKKLEEIFKFNQTFH